MALNTDGVGGPDHRQLEPDRALATKAGGARARRLSLSLSLTPMVASDPDRSWRARRRAWRMPGSCGRCRTGLCAPKGGIPENRQKLLGLHSRDGCYELLAV